MIPAIFPLLFIGFIVLIIIGAIYSAKKARQRRDALLLWASQNGLQFSPGNDGSFEGRFPMFKCLKSGEGDRYAYNILTGGFRGRDLIVFDYHYITTSTDSKGNRETHHHHFSAAMIRSDIPLLPLHIRPENVFDKLAGFFGYEDINFESAEFSRRFHVASSDRKWAYDVLHPRTIEFLLSRSRNNIQLDTQWVMIWAGSTWQLDGMVEAIDTVRGVLDGFPPYLVEQQKELANGRS